jgi:hypothetical protein
MSARANVMFDDEVWAGLQELAPEGERSKVVNEAVSEWLLRKRREQLFAHMDEIRRIRPLDLDGLSAEEWVRRDRESH